jgi:hypothetical protein
MKTSPVTTRVIMMAWSMAIRSDLRGGIQSFMKRTVATTTKTRVASPNSRPCSLAIRSPPGSDDRL